MRERLTLVGVLECLEEIWRKAPSSSTRVSYQAPPSFAHVTLGDFLMREVPRIASRLAGPGREADFRQEFLAKLVGELERQGLNSVVRLEETSLAGRSDARVGRFQFEFKSPGELESAATRTRALRQVLGYCDQATDKHGTAAGVATDGIQTCLVLPGPDGKHRPVDGTLRPLSHAQAFRPWSEHALNIERIVGHLAQPKLTAETLLEQFGLSTAVAQSTLRALAKSLDEDNTEFTKLLYGQWQLLFALALNFTVETGPDSEIREILGVRRQAKQEDWDRAVFLLHTYYSILLKLLAVRIVDELRLAGGVALLGEIERDPQRGINLAEARIPELLADIVQRDVFSWPYAREAGAMTMAVRTAVSEMARRMSGFDVRGVRTDTLRRVYQNLIPTQLRKSLGEYYTPTWAADLVLREVGYEGNGRLLDPTCGSGTFLVGALSAKMSKLSEVREEDVRRFTGEVVGFDLNPIAVATARLNYVLVLVDALERVTLREPLRIPVFLCDSLLPPRLQSAHLDPHYEVVTSIGPLKIPILDATSPVDSTRKVLRILHREFTAPLASFLGSIRTEFGAEKEASSRALLAALHRRIYELHVAKRDGLWTGIVENFFAPQLQGKFDYVVGNPPWVIPRRTPPDYTAEVRKRVEGGLLEPAERDFIVLPNKYTAADKQYFACTPFVSKAITSYLKPEGVNGFLMTSSMLMGLSAGGWRRWAAGRHVEAIVDLTLVTDIHEGAQCWAWVPIIKAGQSPAGHQITYKFADPVEPKDPARPDDGPRKIEWHQWKVRVADLPIAPSRKLVSKTEFMPSTAPWLVAPPPIIKSIRRMQVKAARANGGKTRLGDLLASSMGFKADLYALFGLQDKPLFEGTTSTGTNQRGETVTVEADLMVCTAVGRGIKAWSFDPHYAFLPLDREGRILSERDLKSYPLAEAYLTDHRDELARRAQVRQGYVEPWYGVQTSPALRGYRVAHKLIAKQMEACVLPPTVKLRGKNVRVMPDQSVRTILAPDKDSAYLLAGQLNSTPLRLISYLMVNPKGSVPFRQFTSWGVGFVPIILGDLGDERAQEVVHLAEEMSADPTSAPGRQADLDRAVGRLFDLSDREVAAFADHLKLMQRHALAVEEPTEDSDEEG